MFSQFLRGRAAHAFCRASFSSLLCQIIFHRTCRWTPSTFKECRSVSMLRNNPWPHNKMDTIQLLHIVKKIVCWQLAEVTSSQNPRQIGNGHQPSFPWPGKSKSWNTHGKGSQRNKCMHRLQWKSANTFWQIKQH